MINLTARTAIVSLSAIMALSSTAAFAKDKDKDALSEAPPIFQAVVDCMDITIAADRLACFDEKVGSLAEAQQNKQVVVADREQIKEERRGLFGLSLPKIRLFGAGSDEKDEEERIKQLDTTIASARQFGYGKWIFTVAAGGTWQQVGGDKLNRDPKPGDTVNIKAGAIGSYLANIAGQRAIRVKRIE